MKIFLKPATWFVLMGVNGAFAFDNLIEADFVPAAVNAVAVFACLAVLNWIKNQSSADTNRAEQ